MVSVRDTEVVMLEMVQPFDANSIGRLFGGRILEWIANVGTVATVRFSRGPTVLAYMDRHFFLAPAFIGDTVTLRARVEYVGRSSMETYIEAIRRHNGEEVVMTMTTASYVAVDEYGQPRLVKNELKPNPDELMIYNNAKARYEARKGRIANRREERYNVKDPTEGLRWRVESSRWVTPQDAFMANMVSAGRLLAWIDNIAASLASEYAKSVVVTGSIVYRDPGFQKIVKEIPLEFILTETDSPYLDPIEKGKAVNNSWKIIYSLEKISEIKDIDKKEVEEIIFNNFVKVYNINNDE